MHHDLKINSQYAIGSTKYKVIRHLGQGHYSTVFLIRDTKTDALFALKRTKLPLNFENDFMYKKIHFYENFIRNLPPKLRQHFNVMYNYSIKQCNYVPRFLQVKDHNYHAATESDANLREKFALSNVCHDLLLDYKEHNFFALLKSGAMTRTDRYRFVVQMMLVLQTLKQHKITHNDIHPNNILYTIDKRTGAPVYVLIDYDDVLHERYLNRRDKEYHHKLHQYRSRLKNNGDLIQFINNVLINEYLIVKTLTEKLHLPIEPFNPHIAIDGLFSKHRKTWTKVKRILLGKREKIYAEWYDYYEKKNIFMDEFYVYDDIIVLFRLLNSRAYIEIFSPLTPATAAAHRELDKIKPFLPARDVAFVLLNKLNFAKIGAYMRAKIGAP